MSALATVSRLLAKLLETLGLLAEMARLAEQIWTLFQELRAALAAAAA